MEKSRIRAEAEIFYKTLYDPAVYNNSGATGTVDATNSWTDTQIGRLWWIQELRFTIICIKVILSRTTHIGINCLPGCNNRCA